MGSADRFLHQAAQKSATTLLARTSSDSASQVPILKALLAGPHGNLEFDKISKTKTVETLLSQVDHSNFSEFTAMYEELLFQPCAANEKEAASKRSVAADQLVSTMRSLQGNRKVTFPNAIEALFIHNIMALLGKCAYLDLQILPSVGSSKPSPPIPQSSRENFKSRVSSCLLHLIAKDIDPAYFAHDLISTLRSYDDNSKPATLLIEGDDSVMKVIAKAWSSSEVRSLNPSTPIKLFLNLEICLGSKCPGSTPYNSLCKSAFNKASEAYVTHTNAAMILSASLHLYHRSLCLAGIFWQLSLLTLR